MEQRLSHVGERKRRLEEAAISAPQLTTEQATHGQRNARNRSPCQGLPRHARRWSVAGSPYATGCLSAAGQRCRGAQARDPENPSSQADRQVAPWMSERAHFDLPSVHRAIRFVHTGRPDPSRMPGQAETRMFCNPEEQLGEI